MTIYNVTIFREMRLLFRGIEADSPEVAARIASDNRTVDADDIDDCDGETLTAMVDEVNLQGDTLYDQSRVIDFDAERLRQAAPKLLAASKTAFFQFEHCGEESDSDRDVLNQLQAAIAQAKAVGIASATGLEPARFEIVPNREENPDRVHVLVDGKFDVAVIRTDEGVVVDVYPSDAFETIATTYAFDSDAEAATGERNRR